MPKLIEDNLIQSLSHLGHSHRLLYRILWEMADPAGVVIFDLDAISCAAGVSYHYADFDVFENRVIRMKATKLLLPMYLVTTVKTLSVKSPGQNKVWIAIQDHWGATKSNPKPFYDAWKQMGVGHLAPKLPEIYVQDHAIPDWLKKHRQKLDMVEAMISSQPSIAGWSEQMVEDFQDFVRRRIEIAREETNRSECRKVLIDTKIVLTLQRQVQKAINKGKTPDQICSDIRTSLCKNYSMIYT
jgi:hypothetical protein